MYKYKINNGFTIKTDLDHYEEKLRLISLGEGKRWMRGKKLSNSGKLMKTGDLHFFFIKYLACFIHLEPVFLIKRHIITTMQFLKGLLQCKCELNKNLAKCTIHVEHVIQ